MDGRTDGEGHYYVPSNPLGRGSSRSLCPRHIIHTQWYPYINFTGTWQWHVPLRMVNISRNVCTRFCCALYYFGYKNNYPSDLLTNIAQGCFAGTGAPHDCPAGGEVPRGQMCRMYMLFVYLYSPTLIDMDKFSHQNTRKHKAYACFLRRSAIRKTTSQTSVTSHELMASQITANTNVSTAFSAGYYIRKHESSHS